MPSSRATSLTIVLAKDFDLFELALLFELLNIRSQNRSLVKGFSAFMKKGGCITISSAKMFKNEDHDTRFVDAGGKSPDVW